MAGGKKREKSLLTGKPYKLLRGMSIVLQKLGSDSVWEVGFRSRIRRSAGAGAPAKRIENDE